MPYLKDFREQHKGQWYLENDANMKKPITLLRRVILFLRRRDIQYKMR